MKHPTEPSTHNTGSAVPYLPIDLVNLQDTHAIRIDPSMKRKGAWRDSDVTTVRRAMCAWLRPQGLPTDSGHPVPLYWLQEWLTGGPLVGPRTPQAGAAWEARLTLVYALNRPYSGLELVPQRRMQHAS